MATMTEVALAELDERGSQFSEVDGAPFLEQVSGVDTDNATRVGGMDVIEEVSAQ